MAPHLVAMRIATFAEKQLHLLGRLDPKAQDVYIDANNDVLWQKPHESKSGSRAKQRTPHGGEHLGADSLEDAKYAVCCAQGEKGRG